MQAVLSGREEITHTALMQSMSGLAATMTHMITQLNTNSKEIRDVGSMMHSVDKRLAIIEANSLSSEVETLKREMREVVLSRLVKLEMDGRSQQGIVIGQSSIMSLFVKLGPWLIMLITAIAVLVHSGSLKF